MISYKIFDEKIHFVGKEAGKWIIKYSRKAPDSGYPSTCFVSIDLAYVLRRLGLRAETKKVLIKDIPHYLCHVKYGKKVYMVDPTAIQFSGEYSLDTLPKDWLLNPCEIKTVSENSVPKNHIDLNKSAFKQQYMKERYDGDFFLDYEDRKRFYLSLKMKLRNYEKSKRNLR